MFDEYLDFVALMKQDNTLLSGNYTVDYEIEHAGIHRDSVLLDLAGSTGYSSRYCFEKTGSSAEGIDISEVAIIIARELAAKLAADSRLRYQASDACSLPFYAETFMYLVDVILHFFKQENNRCLRSVVF
ncbi:class I SAM-dependent methyltransferase [Bartonella sp. MM73XJBT.G]|uniref:class I SAM-dependent methyltransferase n=1 Tax=Bartonella sp. MM73XJBT.G TaxID=3019097 RepID=UPI00235F5FCE|nr:class I SAM-dependent methyltransferase [Bartonella sp. MM73XJBT.G]